MRFVKISDIQEEIRRKAKDYAARAGKTPVVALPQGPQPGQLRVKQVAGPGIFPLVPGHPALDKDRQ